MYKTGEMHPAHNLLAFVRYDENGLEEWTSIIPDPLAPYRMALKSAQDALERKSSESHSTGSEYSRVASLG